jgi:hypothetical protein
MQAITHKPCSRCGCLRAWLSKDGGLRCTRCRYERGNLSATAASFITAVEARFGRITEAVVLRQKKEAPSAAEPQFTTELADPRTELGDQRWDT